MGAHYAYDTGQKAEVWTWDAGCYFSLGPGAVGYRCSNFLASIEEWEHAAISAACSQKISCDDP